MLTITAGLKSFIHCAIYACVIEGPPFCDPQHTPILLFKKKVRFHSSVQNVVNFRIDFKKKKKKSSKTSICDNY